MIALAGIEPGHVVAGRRFDGGLSRHFKFGNLRQQELKPGEFPAYLCQQKGLQSSAISSLKFCQAFVPVRSHRLVIQDALLRTEPLDPVHMSPPFLEQVLPLAMRRFRSSSSGVGG